jgi:hypothetical protein
LTVWAPNPLGGRQPYIGARPQGSGVERVANPSPGRGGAQPLSIRQQQLTRFIGRGRLSGTARARGAERLDAPFCEPGLGAKALWLADALGRPKGMPFPRAQVDRRQSDKMALAGVWGGLRAQTDHPNEIPAGTRPLVPKRVNRAGATPLSLGWRAVCLPEASAVTPRLTGLLPLFGV